MRWTAAERALMARALRLARRPRRRVSPNPRVGAVVVKGGEIVGEGYHRGVGTAHAEAMALSRAGRRARGGDLYLNLEPCKHHGHTPPCTEAILAAGIRRVVCSLRDPDPRVAGGGIRRLRSAGVAVEVGLMEQEARELNEAYLISRGSGRPRVTLKLALTLDGRIADRGGSSRWITGAGSRQMVHRLRSGTDVVMVGRGTVERDDPRLTVRHVSGHNPSRLVVDSRLRLDPDRRFFRQVRQARTLVATTEDAPERRRRRLAQMGVEVWSLKATPQGRVDLPDLLFRACAEGMTDVLVEGGGQLGSALLREGLVDRVFFFYAPTLLGNGGSVRGLGDLGVGRLSQALRVEGARWRRVGSDLLLTGVPSAPGGAGRHRRRKG